MAVVSAIIGLLLASLVKAQHVEIQPLEAVRRIGDEVVVLCKVAYPIDSCRMIVGGESYRLLPTNQGEDVSYSGRGLSDGECGARIKNIRESWNGNVSCVLPPQSGSIELTAVMRLVVARAPNEPQLISRAQPNYLQGDTFQAQCVVPGGRPAAKITWLMDEQPLLEGIHQPIITTEPGSDLQSISQNVTRTLSADDNGRRLECKVEHEALDQPRVKALQISVHYPPQRLESGPITIFGLKIGEEGRLNVTVRANPAPGADWTVGDRRLGEGQSTTDGSVTNLPPVHLGGGYYNCTLLLARVAKEDVERTYYLQVNNDLGTEEFAVRLSTMDEPAGVELDTGAIVGIVIGVLVLLIAVFLVVFAKATDRWCFAGGRRDHTKSSGESSDTESAVGGKVERSRLAELSAKVRAVLPKAKDKVQATDAAAEEEKAAEDKKGVVYAELALGESQDKPPIPDTTEYAVIVYTDRQTDPNEPKTETKDPKD